MQQESRDSVRGSLLQQGQAFAPLRPGAVLVRGRVDHPPSADGGHGGHRADDELVAGIHQHLLLEAELGVAGLPRGQGLPVGQHHLHQHLGRAMVHPGPEHAGDHVGRVCEQRQSAVGQIGGLDGRVFHHPLPAVDVLAGDTREVQSHPLPSGGDLHFAVVHLDAPYPHLAQIRGASPGAGRQNGDNVLGAERPRPQSAGDHRPDATQREDPVDRHASRRIRAPGRNLPPQTVELGQ